MAFKLPFLKNFRRGFATNSSSSHSFVYLKEPVPGAQDNHMVDVDDFGWNDFRLDTIKEKLFYVLSNRIGDGSWKAPAASAVDEAWENYHEEFPELSRDDFIEVMKTSVDHQSRGTIGIEEARDPRVVVFGGNDNSDGSQERADVVRSGLVDWELTDPIYEDAEHLPRSEKRAWEKLYESDPWLREEHEDEESF
jgi:hypothetical protein